MKDNFELGSWVEAANGRLDAINPIQLSAIEEERNFNESFALGSWAQEVTESNIFTEAVFADGKDKLDPIVKGFAAIKAEIEAQTTGAGANPKKKYNTKDANMAFWRSLNFKTLEDAIQKVFGLRSVQIDFKFDAFNYKSGKFMYTPWMNCYTYTENRYPIDGLVTDKGFYDSTHSINMYLCFTLPAFVNLGPEELTALFLHEFGHNIDPALVDINYAKANALSKYLTDRAGAMTKAEKSAIDEGGKQGFSGVLYGIGYVLLNAAACILGAVAGAKLGQKIAEIIQKRNAEHPMNSDKKGEAKGFFGNTEEKLLEKIKRALSEDGKKFNRVTNQEAFADNFPRMYGFGPALARSFRAMQIETKDLAESRFKKEKARQKFIARVAIAGVGDIHKTEIHRIKALIHEYEADLNNPDIPFKVKKNIEADKIELEKILEEFLKDEDKFVAKVNKLIADSIDKKYAKEAKKESK